MIMIEVLIVGIVPMTKYYHQYHNSYYYSLDLSSCPEVEVMTDGLNGKVVMYAVGSKGVNLKCVEEFGSVDDAGIDESMEGGAIVTATVDGGDGDDGWT